MSREGLVGGFGGTLPNKITINAIFMREVKLLIVLEIIAIFAKKNINL